MSPRQYIRWEDRLISEWLARIYPDTEYRMHVRLGPDTVRDEEGKFSPTRVRMHQVYKARCDAIVFLKDRLLLIEAAVIMTPTKVTQLELYRRMIPTTPDLAPWRHLPIEPILLYCIEHPQLAAMAREKGFRTIQYEPEWLEDRLARLEGRKVQGDWIAPI